MIFFGSHVAVVENTFEQTPKHIEIIKFWHELSGFYVYLFIYCYEIDKTYLWSRLHSVSVTYLHCNQNVPGSRLDKVLNLNFGTEADFHGL